MTCPTITDISCYINGVVGSVAGPVSSGFLSTLASGVRSGLTWVFTNSVTLWLKVPSPYLTSDQPELDAVHHFLFPVTAAVAVGGAVTVGARMALTRKHGPLLDLSGGLAIIGLVTAVGTLLPTVLMQAGDQWTDWVLSVSTGGNFTKRLNTLLSAGYGHDIPDIVVIFFGAAAMVASAIQGVLLLFRQAAVLVLAGVLPLAAAGALAPATRNWIKKITGWMLALICYKPAAACVYATAFTMIGSSSGWRALLTGFAMIILSVVALPVFIRFFTWTVGSVASSGGGGGGGGQLLGLAAAGALGLGALRGGGASSSGTAAIRQTEYMSPPPAGGGNAGGGNPGSGPDGPGGGNPPAGSGGGTASPGAADPGRTPRGGSPAPGRWPQDKQSGSADTGPGDSVRPTGRGRAGQGGAGTPTAGGQGAPDRGTPGRGIPGRDAPGGGSQGTGAAAPDGAGAWRGSGTGPDGVAPSRRQGEGNGQGTSAAASFAALFAAQALASGAQDAAAATAQEEERT